MMAGWRRHLLARRGNAGLSRWGRQQNEVAVVGPAGVGVPCGRCGSTRTLRAPQRQRALSELLSVLKQQPKEQCRTVM